MIRSHAQLLYWSLNLIIVYYTRSALMQCNIDDTIATAATMIQDPAYPCVRINLDHTV